MAIPHIEYIDGKCPHGRDAYKGEECTRCEMLIKAYETAEPVVDQLSHLVNGSVDIDALASLLANEHPTLLGQIAKAVAIGVVRRADYNPAWKPFEDFKSPACTLYPDHRPAFEAHPDHDGRLSCELVVGSLHAARQFYV